MILQLQGIVRSVSSETNVVSIPILSTRLGPILEQLFVEDKCWVTRALTVEIISSLHRKSMIKEFSISFETSLTENLFRSNISEIPIWYPLYNRAVSELICRILASKRIDGLTFKALLTHPNYDVTAECLKFLTQNVEHFDSNLVDAVLARMSTEKNVDCLKMMIDACAQWYDQAFHNDAYQTMTDAHKTSKTFTETPQTSKIWTKTSQTSKTLIDILKKVDSSSPLFASGVRFAGLLVSSKEVLLCLLNRIHYKPKVHIFQLFLCFLVYVNVSITYFSKHRNLKEHLTLSCLNSEP